MSDHRVDAGPVNWEFRVKDYGSIVGPDGNALGDVLLNGVAELDYVSLNGRIYTAAQREPFAPNFGCGLPQALFAREPLPAANVAARLRASFADDPNYQSRSITVALAVRGRVLDLELGATANAR